MGDKLFKDIAFKLDNATGTLTAITGQLNSVALNAIQNTLENTALDDEEQSFLTGVAGMTIPLNGFLNSTIHGIIAPIAGNRTTVTKTWEYSPYTGKYLNGECWLSNIAITGASNTLQTWSATLTVTGAVNNTTKAIS